MTIGWETENRRKEQGTGLILRLVSNDRTFGQNTQPHLNNF